MKLLHVFFGLLALTLPLFCRVPQEPTLVSKQQQKEQLVHGMRKQMMGACFNGAALLMIGFCMLQTGVLSKSALEKMFAEPVPLDGASQEEIAIMQKIPKRDFKSHLTGLSYSAVVLLTLGYCGEKIYSNIKEHLKTYSQIKKKLVGL